MAQREVGPSEVSTQHPRTVEMRPEYTNEVHVTPDRDNEVGASSILNI